MEDNERYERHFEIVDKETGKMIVDKRYVGRSSNGKDWNIVYHMTQHLLATNKMFRGADIRTYLLLSSKLDYKCKCAATTAALAEEMDLSYQQVHSSLKLLQGTDLVREQRVDGVKTYYINPYWQTRGKNHGQLIEIYEAIPPKIPQDLEFLQPPHPLLQ